MWKLFALVALGCVACGGSGDATDAGDEVGVVMKKDAGAEDVNVVDVVEASTVIRTDAGYPAPHPDVPQVVTANGPVLTAPNVVPIFFQNDPSETSLESFMTQLAGSSFWTSTTSEYGVGPLTVASSIVVTDTAPAKITDTQIQTWLASYLDGTHPEWPAPALNNIYTIFYPQTTVIDDGSGTSCNAFGGYHYDVTAGASTIVYAVIPRCPGFANLNGVDATTGALSHELVEASTDPLGTAYSYTDQDHAIWSIAPLGEVGDMCAYEPQSYDRLLGSFVAQRMWSNASALAGHDPCVPVLAAPYYNAAPVLDDDVTLNFYGQKVTTKGVQIPLNTSKTIAVDLFSDAPRQQWYVDAEDETFGQGTPELLFSWDAQYGKNGDILHVTITRVANGPYGGSELYLYSEDSQTNYNMWFGFIAN